MVQNIIMQPTTPKEATMSEPIETQKVTITDFDMPFWSLICFMVKLAICAIPAIIIISLLYAFFGMIVAGCVKGI